MRRKDLFGHLNKRLLRIFVGLLNEEPIAVMQAIRALGGIPPGTNRGRKSGRRATASLRAGDTIETAREKLNLGPRSIFVGLSKPKLFNTNVALAKKDSVNTVLACAEGWRHEPIRRLRAEVSPRLGKCAKCGRYFLATNERKGRRYCPRRLRNCASNATAKAAVYRKRAAEKRESLARAQAAIRSWPGTGDWKDFVARRAGLSRKFLTQATNRGDLKAPAWDVPAFNPEAVRGCTQTLSRAKNQRVYATLLIYRV